MATPRANAKGRMASVSAKRLAEVGATVSEILRWYYETPEPLRFQWGAWYRRALAVGEDLAREARAERETAIAILALTSQQLGWSKNVEVARLILCDRRYTHPLPAVNLKAQRIMDGEAPADVISGQKITRFWQCILSAGTDPIACIDRWALRGAVPEWTSKLAGDVTIAPTAYAALEEMYRTAAEVAGVHTPEMQAVVWCAVRGSAD